MPGKYVKTKYRGVFSRNGIAYIRYAVPGKKRGSVVWESTGQRNTQLAAERLRQRKTEIAEGRYFSVHARKYQAKYERTTTTTE